MRGSLSRRGGGSCRPQSGRSGYVRAISDGLVAGSGRPRPDRDGGGRHPGWTGAAVLVAVGGRQDGDGLAGCVGRRSR